MKMSKLNLSGIVAGISVIRAFAVALLLGAVFAAGNAKAQQNASKYVNQTIRLVIGEAGPIHPHVSTNGVECMTTSSNDDSVRISIGDFCEARVIVSDARQSLYATITMSKITFRDAGKDYAITDAATVKRARNLFEPLEMIAQQQPDLGKQQGKLGERQSDLGDLQSELGDLQSRSGDLQAQVGNAQ